MLSIVLGISIASLTSGQPMSLNEPRSCDYFTCSDAILGIKLQFQLISYSSFLCSLGAAETCLSTGSAEEVIDCVKNILESIGQGDCKACICHIIPQFCHDKEKERVSLVKMAKPSQCWCCPLCDWMGWDYVAKRDSLVEMAKPGQCFCCPLCSNWNGGELITVS